VVEVSVPIREYHAWRGVYEVQIVERFEDHDEIVRSDETGGWGEVTLAVEGGIDDYDVVDVVDVVVRGGRSRRGRTVVPPKQVHGGIVGSGAHPTIEVVVSEVRYRNEADVGPRDDAIL
jgi:hypothetical protein